MTPNPQYTKWYPSAKNRKLILDFILWFSRFEYALKSTYGLSYIAGRPGREYLSPNWRAFSNSLENHEVPETLSKVLSYLRENPPNRQADHDDWQPVSENLDWPFLITCLQTIRNNLFHGGKQNPALLLSDKRDERLVSYCLDIMYELIEIAPLQTQVAFQTA